MIEQLEWPSSFWRLTHQDLEKVIPKGEVYGLTELGTYCRGALFLDGSQLITPELEGAVDAMSRGVKGFHFRTIRHSSSF